MTRTLSLLRRPETVNAATTLADQGVVSLVNFAAMVVVAQAGGPSELGVYALCFTGLVLLAAAFDAFFISPYMARALGLALPERAAYAGSTAAYQAIAILPAAGLLALFALVFADGPAAAALAASALAAPCLLAKEFLRRLAMAERKPWQALVVDSVTGTVQLAAIGILAATGHLTAAAALLAIAGASVAGVAVRLAIAMPALRFSRDALGRHLAGWEAGVWTFAALMTFLLSYYAPLWILGAIGTKHETGLFSACQNLVMISNPLVIGLSNSLMPQAAHAFAGSAEAGVRRLVRNAAAMLMAPMILFLIPLCLFGGPLLAAFYGEAFAGQGTSVAILALAATLRAAGMSPYIGLWATGRSRTNCVVNLLGFAVTAALLALLFPAFGIVGVAAAVLAGDTLAALVRAVLFHRLTRGAAA